MDPVEVRTFGSKSLIAAKNVDYGRAVERYAAGQGVVFGDNQVITDGETAWAPEANVTQATVAGVKGNCQKLTVAGAFTTGLIATLDFAVIDLSAKEAIGFFIKSTGAQVAGALQIGVDETAALGGSPVYQDVPALVADQWYYFSLPFTGAVSARNAVVSVGLNAVSDPAAVDIFIDEVGAGATFRGIGGFSGFDEIVPRDSALLDKFEAGIPFMTIVAGQINAFLEAGITCVAEQQLYPVPGGKLTTTPIVMDGRPIYAYEDQATAGGRVGVIF